VAANTKPDPGPGIAKNLVFSLACVICFLLVVETVMQLAGLAAARSNKPKLRQGAEVIVCVGDSHTYGVMVGKDRTYPAQLEKILNEKGGNFQVLNLGAPGQNSTQVLKSLPGISEKYHPSILIVLVGVNNIWNVAGQQDNLTQLFLDRLKLYRLARIIYFQKLTTRAEFKVASLRDENGYLMHYKRRAEPKNDQEIQDIYMRLSDELLAITDYCQAHKIRMVIMDYAGYSKDDYYAVNKICEMVAQIKRVPFVDNNAYFVSRLRGPDGNLDFALYQKVFQEDMHLTDFGYGWMAQNIHQVLKKEHMAK
jgi:lysophospholipase L1-like esterase